jgi:hypothetical protein
MLKTDTYADLEIRLMAPQAEGYPIELTLNSERELGRGYLLPALVKQWVASATPTADGEKLFAWLMGAEAVKQVWHEVRGEWPLCRLRLRLDTGAPELHRLPWELLRIPAPGPDTPAHDLAAAVATPFSRYLAGKWRPGNPIVQRPIKILVAIANPPGLAGYDLQPVEEDVEQKLIQAAGEGLAVELAELKGSFTLSDLERELKKGYHILYFVGHGSFIKEEDQAILFMAGPGKEGKQIADEPALVNETQFRDMLARLDEGEQNPLRLIYLSSCQTATRSTADAFRGFAPALVQAGIPAVLAMQEKVPVDTAQAFARTFFGQLLQHGQVDLAANEARAALMTGDYLGAAIPVLFMRLRGGLLFGRRGQILGERADGFWDDLLYNIKEGECVPFLGPGVTAELLPNPAELAQTLALENHYPFADQDNLLKVAQYLGTMNNKRLRRETLRSLVRGFKRRTDPAVLQPEATGRPGELAETIAAAWAELDDQALLKSEIHHQLAALDLPIYLTTNFDNCMALALEKVRGVTVRQVTVSWQNLLKKTAERPQLKLDPPPAKEKPVVVHLFGADAKETDLTSLILTEDDYLDYLSVISRDYDYLLQTDIQAALAANTLLFLGYRLEDLDLKLIMRGLLTHLDLEKWDMPHVAVQLEGSGRDPEAEKEVIRFFERYFSNLKIDVYWGSTQQFVADLYARWQEYR